MPVLGDEARPALELRRSSQRSRDIVLIEQTFGHDHMGDRVDDGDIRPGLELQVIVGLHMRRPHEIDLARIDDDQLRALRAAGAFMRDPNTGCASVGLAPMTMMTSQWSTEAKSCVPAEVPSVAFKP